MAREKSATVPRASRSAAAATPVAEWLIMPGKMRPTLMVRMATATKMSSSAATNAELPVGTLLTANR